MVQEALVGRSWVTGGELVPWWHRAFVLMAADVLCPVLLKKKTACKSLSILGVTSACLAWIFPSPGLPVVLLNSVPQKLTAHLPVCSRGAVLWCLGAPLVAQAPSVCWCCTQGVSDCFGSRLPAWKSWGLGSVPGGDGPTCITIEGL